jgi:hypothetical protein
MFGVELCGGVRRRLPLAVLAVLLAGEVLAVRLLAPRPNCVTWPNYNRIEEGMRRSDAERILGGPPGVYGQGFLLGDNGLVRETITSPGWARGAPDTANVWVGDNVRILLAFNPEGRVSGKWLAHPRSADDDGW